LRTQRKEKQIPHPEDKTGVPFDCVPFGSAQDRQDKRDDNAVRTARMRWPRLCFTASGTRRFSFGAQRDDWVDTRSASRGQVACEHSHQEKQQRNGGDRRQVVRGKAEKHA
jgi:hypothetical protein